MTRPILASIDLQALKQKSDHYPPGSAGRSRLVGGESQCIWTRH
ncbi:Uncharacterised protein [Citrobacter freundii]|nr:Uncharacterised protein [Citrobacter freundii]